MLLLGARRLPRPSAPSARRPAPRRLHPVATDTRVGGDDAQTRFVMDFSQKVDVRAFTLADPYRVVIDLPQVTFKLPPKAGENGRGLVKAFRYGLVMQGGSRIVMDVTKPVRIDKAFVLDAGRRASRRGWCSISSPIDRESFMRRRSRSKIGRRARRDRRRGERDAAAEGRSAAADRARSRPWRHRQRHHRGERRDGKGHRARIRAAAARQAREDPANTAS